LQLVMRPCADYVALHNGNLQPHKIRSRARNGKASRFLDATEL